jgi:hypothetical protein
MGGDGGRERLMKLVRGEEEGDSNWREERPGKEGGKRE